MTGREATAEERIHRYRLLAEEAEALAGLTLFPDLREDYLRYARCWRALADETKMLAIYL